MSVLRSSLLTAAAALSLMAATSATAQDSAQRAPEDTTQIHGRLAIRSVTAALGWIPGAFIGGYIGYALRNHAPCSCDDPGLSETLLGITVGGAVGAGLGAAAPPLGSHCSFAQRFGLGLLGAAVGSGVGLIPIRHGSQPLTVPLFSSVGAGLAQRPC